MSKKDVNDLKYDPEIVKNLIKLHFPNSNVISSEKIKRGIMNLVIDVKLDNPAKDIILKLSNVYKKHGIEKEKYVFDLLRQKTDVPVPIVYGFDFTRKKFPFEYIIVSKLKGDLLEDIWDKLDKKQQEELAYEMGKILAKINSIKFKSFGMIYTKKRTKHYKSFLEMMDDDINDSIKRIRRDKFFSDLFLNEFIGFFDKNLEPLLKDAKEPCLIHNDFHFWHIIVDKDKQDKFYINGVLDFGFAEKGHKSQDFIKPTRWIFDKGDNINENFIKGYVELEDFSKKDEKILKILKIYYDLVFSWRMFKTGNDELAKEYLDIVKKSMKKYSIS